jgi:pimeloyl-ACP methyl ester carboxylesterase
VTQHIDIDGVRLSASCRGVGTPPVAFVHGVTGDLSEWEDVRKKMKADVATVAHSRPGRGGSGSLPDSRRPATVYDLAVELKVVLAELGISRPRVLVGQSIGALVLASYAAHWPGDVSGLVMVEPTHLRFWSLVADPAPLTDGEGGFVIDRDQSTADHRALPPLPAVPAVVVSAHSDRWLRIGDPDAYNVSQAGMSRLWELSQCEWADQLQAERVLVDGAGHVVQKDAPGVVALAVDAVVAAARAQGRLRLDWDAMAAAGGRPVGRLG